MPSDAYLDALVFYRTTFPDLASLGVGAPPAKWKAEFDRVSADAFGSVLAVGANSEGGGMSGVRNFDAVQRFRALHARRAELDTDYVNPYTQAATDPRPGRRIGFVVRMGH